jgi:hypothetical protein
VAPGEKLFEGLGGTSQLAKENAINALKLTVLDSVIQTQYLSKAQNNEKHFQYNQQVISKGAITGIEHISVVPCSEGYKAYLLYNARSLETQIAQFFKVKKYHLIGESYLTNSELLMPYHQASSKETLIVRMFKGQGDEYFLFLGEHKIKIRKKSLQQLINVAALQVTKPDLDFTVNKERSRFGLYEFKVTQQHKKAKANTKASHVFVCKYQGLCQLLHSGFKNEQVGQIFVDVQQPIFNQEVIFIAVQQDIVNLSLLYDRYESNGLFIPLLNTVNRYPTKSHVKTIAFRSF